MKLKRFKDISYDDYIQVGDFETTIDFELKYTDHAQRCCPTGNFGI